MEGCGEVENRGKVLAPSARGAGQVTLTRSFRLRPTGYAGQAGPPSPSQRERGCKVVCGLDVGAPTHRFARAVCRGRAQSKVGKSNFLNRGRLGTCRADTPFNLPFCARKTRSRPEKVEGAARADTDARADRPRLFDN